MWRYICKTYNLIPDPENVLVNHNFLPSQSRMEVIRTYGFSYIAYFWCYYGNPILSPYVKIWI